MSYRVLVGEPLDNEDQFVKIQAVIDTKRQMLLDKQNLLKKATKTNHFLDTVKEDYITYYNFIAQQKQDQIKAIQMLNEYIDDLSSSGELSKHNMEDARVEQTKLLREIKKIQGGLDSLITSTKHITNELDNKT